MRFTIVCLLIYFSFWNSALSQKYDNKIDSISIEFKAKILTASRFGITKRQDFLSEIQNQELSYLKTGTSNILVMKIKFNQTYYLWKEKGEIKWLGGCDFYVAFNLNKSKFYRLGGFEVLDLTDFFEDLKSSDFSIFDISLESGIDFLCLKRYSEMSPKKRLKEKSICYPTCLRESNTRVIQN